MMGPNANGRRESGESIWSPAECHQDNSARNKDPAGRTKVASGLRASEADETRSGHCHVGHLAAKWRPPEDLGECQPLGALPTLGGGGERGDKKGAADVPANCPTLPTASRPRAVENCLLRPLFFRSGSSLTAAADQLPSDHSTARLL